MKRRGFIETLSALAGALALKPALKIAGAPVPGRGLPPSPIPNGMPSWMTETGGVQMEATTGVACVVSYRQITPETEDRIRMLTPMDFLNGERRP